MLRFSHRRQIGTKFISEWRKIIFSTGILQISFKKADFESLKVDSASLEVDIPNWRVDFESWEVDFASLRVENESSKVDLASWTVDSANLTKNFASFTAPLVMVRRMNPWRSFFYFMLFRFILTENLFDSVLFYSILTCIPFCLFSLLFVKSTM